jgi:hypothetical protein
MRHVANESDPPTVAEPPERVPDAEPTTAQSGWLPPDPSGGRRTGRRSLAIGCALVAALFLAGPLIFLAIYNLSSPASPGVQTVEFGRGGSGCAVTRTDTSFPPGTLIRAVAMFAPELQAGTRVAVSMYLDGAELDDYRQVVAVEEPSDCVFLGLAPMEPGRYRLEFAVDPSSLPPVSGEFDITAQ